jgi:hypothetical protein
MCQTEAQIGTIDAQFLQDLDSLSELLERRPASRRRMWAGRAVCWSAQESGPQHLVHTLDQVAPAGPEAGP